MEDDILNYISSVMFRGTPCRYNSIKPNKKLGATFSKFFRCYKVLGLTVLYQYLSWKQFRIIRNRKIILLNIHGVPPKTLEVSDDFDIVFLNNSLIWYMWYLLFTICLFMFWLHRVVLVVQQENYSIQTRETCPSSLFIFQRDYRHIFAAIYLFNKINSSRYDRIIDHKIRYYNANS